jgi:hypothetical protein
MLLELVLLELRQSEPATARSAIFNCFRDIWWMFDGRALISEAAAAAAADAVLQEALLLPTAVLQAAAAAGCPGLWPQPDAEDNIKTVAAGLSSACSDLLLGLLDHANQRGT